jgi:IclR family transcriptional regulator, KDG regulon repressor
MNKSSTTGGTVGKALDILDQIAALGRPVRFSELLENSPHPKATLYRFLQTLSGQGMLSYDADRQTYSLGIRLLRLAHAAWKQSSLAPLARCYIDQLAQTVTLTVHLAQMDNGQVLYIDKRNAADPVDMFSQAGKVGPAYCTGIGKAMMAFLPASQQQLAIQQQSFFAYTPNTINSVKALKNELDAIKATAIAYDREEHETGIICIATAILASGKVIGGVSITSSTNRHSLSDLEDYRSLLLATAADIGKEAVNWQFPSDI